MQETYTWFPLSTCLPLLQRHRYACFSHPEHSLVDPPNEGGECPNSCLNGVMLNRSEDDDIELALFSEEDLDEIRVVTRSSQSEIVLVPTNAS